MKPETPALRRNVLADEILASASRLASAWEDLVTALPWTRRLPPGTRREITERYLPSMVGLIARHLTQPDAALAAIYRDELQRFDLAAGPGSPPALPVTELIALQQRAFRSVLGPGSGVLATLDELNAPLLSAPRAELDMLLLGDCLMNEVRCFLADAAVRSGVRLRGHHVYFSGALSEPFDIATARAVAAGHDIGLIGFSPFTFDALPIYREFLIKASEGPVDDELIDLVISIVVGIITDIRSFSQAPILLHNACGAPAGRSRAELTSLPPLTSGSRAALRLLNSRFGQRIQALRQVHLVDEAALTRRPGLRALSAPAVAGAAPADSLFHTSRLGRELAGTYWQAAQACLDRDQLKVIAVDLDGTLWAGIMAEGRVDHFRGRQELLRKLAHQGVALIALSKGSPDTLRWAEMTIGRDDFAAIRRSWKPKAAELAQALAELGIRPGQAAVVDDSPAELALLVHAFPELTPLDATDERTWQRLAFAQALAEPLTTDEARHRTRYYQAGRTRQEFVTASETMAAGMAQLELRLTLRVLTPGDVPRVMELQQRTNQFNTTGARLAEDELLELAATPPGRVVHVAQLADRFGDFGMIAVVVVSPPEAASGSGSHIESFVMSCRAMGYGVERAILEHVINRSVLPVSARLVPTRLNEPCHGLYAAAGFGEDEPGFWRLTQRSSGWVPEWFTTTDPGGD